MVQSDVSKRATVRTVRSKQKQTGAPLVLSCDGAMDTRCKSGVSHPQIGAWGVEQQLKN